IRADGQRKDRRGRRDVCVPASGQVIDQSTFLNLVAQIAELYELYEQDLIDDRLSDALINILP
ncbi:MAG: hypothetical protein IS632_05835, partial [Thaumarchaeota archaeon]|nr:hypothetical protein [Nitrososphaerota archaeon]